MTQSDAVPTITAPAPTVDAPGRAAPAAPARHIPWVEFARDLRGELQSAGKAGVAALDRALAWASGDSPIPRRIGVLISPNSQRDGHGTAEALTRERDTVFKVALLQALASVLAPAGLTLAQRMAALRRQLANCQQPVPAGLVPVSGAVLADVEATTRLWLEPWLPPATDPPTSCPLRRWNNALALCALEHLTWRMRSLDDLRKDLLNGLPLAAKFSPGRPGKLIDSNGVVALDLHCQPWLTQLLSFSAADDPPGSARLWWTIHFNSLKHLGGIPAGTTRVDGQKKVNMTGLKTANLYYAALAERLRALGQPAPSTQSALSASAGDRAMPIQAIPMKPSQALPSGLTAELQDQLPSGLYPAAACSVFFHGQSLAGGPPSTTDVTALIRGWSGNSRRRPQGGPLKTRRAGAAPVAGLPIGSPTSPDLVAATLGPQPTAWPATSGSRSAWVLRC